MKYNGTNKIKQAVFNFDENIDVLMMPLAI